eukprot:5460061-Prorocentrum_lima.AAC.1
MDTSFQAVVWQADKLATNARSEHGKLSCASTLASEDNAAYLPPWVLKLQMDFATLQSAVEAYMGAAQ